MMSRHKARWTKGVGLLLLLLVIMLPTGNVAAADFRSGDRVIVEEDEVVDDDLFATGNQILIHGTVTGDLIAVGGELLIDGVVEGSVIAGANTVVIAGDVEGSVYAALSRLTLNDGATVGRNVYAGAFSVEARPQSNIGRDLYAAAYQTLANGAIAGNLVANSAALRLGGQVSGDVRAEVAPAGPAPAFTAFMPDAGRNLAIFPPGLQVSDDAVVGGRLAVEESQSVQEETATDILLERLGEFIALLLVGGLWILIAPLLLARAGDAARVRPLPSAGVGCLVTLLFPFALVAAAVLLILLVLLGGFLTVGQLTAELIGVGATGLAFTVAAFAFIFSILTKVVIAYLLGRLLLGRVAAPITEAGRGRHYAYLALGALIYEILRAIPILGVLVATVVILLGLGALLLATRDHPKQPLPNTATSLQPKVTE